MGHPGITVSVPLYALKGNRPVIHGSAFIAPTAQIIGDVVIGEDASVWYHTVIRGDFDRITIGRGTNVQDLTTCHADTGVPLTIGNGVTIGHRVVVHGCTIEDQCLIGMGAIVMNHAVIGRGSVVAAGAVVLERTVVPPFSLVTGMPAAIKKTYDNQADIQQEIKAASKIYIEKARGYTDDTVCYRL